VTENLSDLSPSIGVLIGMNPLLAVLIVAQAQSWQVSIDSLVKNGDYSGSCS
jgi:hypothetical protein